MLTSTLDHRQLQILGKLLMIKKPEVAKELIQYIPKQSDAFESDLSKVPHYFKLFCQLQSLEPNEYTGPLYKSSKIDKRRFFIAVILSLYHPQKRLLQKYISETLQQDPSATRRMMLEVEFRYQNLPDFKDQVNAVVDQIKN